MRTYKVTLTNGSWAEIDHPGPVNMVIKTMRRQPALKDNHGRMILTSHIVTVQLQGKKKT